MPDWDEDDMFDEESSDLGDEVKSEPVVQSSLAPTRPRVIVQDVRPTSNHHSDSASRPKSVRRVKVKPMPPAIANKWPDVVSMLLTTSAGKQTLFVKG